MHPLSVPAQENLTGTVHRIVDEAKIQDIHTHLYDPAFGELLLWGIDDLLVYHYLIAEAFRYLEIPYETFWAFPKTQQAEIIWKELFIEHSPISEACRGVITTLNQLGIDPRKNDLSTLRNWFSNWNVRDYITRCMELARVESICMTNSPFDDLERAIWIKGFDRDPRFHAALRIDPLLVSWPAASQLIASWGYETTSALTQKTFDEARRFLADWTQRMNARYVMVSLSPEFRFPASDECAVLIENVVLPHCREFGIPFALMPGVKRAVNPALRLAGDGVGWSDLQPVQNLCAGYPENKFLVTTLARETQHELCVLARKFRNLH
ncbi:MAG: glucuronate isomerase, partial [Verrucomicrobiota bacterium]|nr:glucuronate isomerase [Verrucomicrobiota bacterium]